MKVYLVILCVCACAVMGCSHKYAQDGGSPAGEATYDTNTTPLALNPDRDPGPVAPPAWGIGGIDGHGGFVTIYFDFDRYNIRDDQKYNMEYNARIAPAPFVLEGYCDERGTIEYNLALGMRRAEAARRHLVKYCGVHPETIIATVSYGELRPVGEGHNEESWAKNRRVEFRLR